VYGSAAFEILAVFYAFQASTERNQRQLFVYIYLTATYSQDSLLSITI